VKVIHSDIVLSDDSHRRFAWTISWDDKQYRVCHFSDLLSVGSVVYIAVNIGFIAGAGNVLLWGIELYHI